MYDIDLLPKNWENKFSGRNWTTESNRTIKYAFVGFGFFAEESMFPAFVESNLGEVTVIVTSSQAEVEERVKTQSVEHVIDYEEFHDGVANDSYDAAYLATPNAKHLKYGRIAAEYGKHIPVKNRWKVVLVEQRS